MICKSRSSKKEGRDPCMQLVSGLECGRGLSVVIVLDTIASLMEG